MKNMSMTPTSEELTKEGVYEKELRKFTKKMDKGETKIKYNKDFTEADLVYKNNKGECVSFPLEWNDKDCLKRVLESIDGAVELIKKLFFEGKISVDRDIVDKWALSMTTLEGSRDTMKAHMSKDDLFIIRDPAKKNYEKYLKRRKKNGHG
jgi:hypothetical protein